MEEKDLVAVEKFVVDCNDMLSGRFLDFVKRLERLLSFMAASESLIDVLASSLENFDENEEMSKAFSLDKKSGTAHVSMPTDDKKKMALVTCLFNKFVSGSLNFTQFLETYFAGDVRAFLSQVLMPYRDAICKAFSLPTDLTEEEIENRKLEALKAKEQEKIEEKEEVAEPELPKLDELLHEIEKNCEQILGLLQFEKKQTENLEDVEFLTNAIVEASKKKDLMMVNALAIGLSYAGKKVKNVRHIIEEMKDSIYEYYDFLASLSGEENGFVDGNA